MGGLDRKIGGADAPGNECRSALQQEGHLRPALDAFPRPFVGPCQERRCLGEGGVLLHRLRLSSPSAAVHLRLTITASHGRLRTGLNAVWHLPTRHAVRRRGRDVRVARRHVDRRVGALAGRRHVARQPNPTPSEAAAGKMQIGMLTVVQFFIVLVEGLLDHALVLRLIAVLVVMTGPTALCTMAATIGPAAMSIAFALHLTALWFTAFQVPLMQHRTAVTAMLTTVDQVLVFRSVHVLSLSVVGKAAVRRVNRGAVVVMVAYRAMRMVDGVAAVGMMLDRPAVRLVLNVHDMVTMRMVLAVHCVLAASLSAFGVMVHDLIMLGRAIRMAVVTPDRCRWCRVAEPEIAVLSPELVVEKVAFDVLDCHRIWFLIACRCWDIYDERPRERDPVPSECRWQPPSTGLPAHDLRHSRDTGRRGAQNRSPAKRGALSRSTGRRARSHSDEPPDSFARHRALGSDYCSNNPSASLRRMLLGVEKPDGSPFSRAY